MDRARIISVNVEAGEAGLLHATSAQMKELLVSGESIEEIREALPAVIRAIFDSHGETVQVLEVENNDVGIPMPWVIVPKGRYAAAR